MLIESFILSVQRLYLTLLLLAYLCSGMPTSTKTVSLLGSCNRLRTTLQNDDRFSADLVPLFPIDSGQLSVCGRGSSPLVATVIPGMYNDSLIVGEPVLDSCCSAQLEEQFMISAANSIPELISQINLPLLRQIQAHAHNLSVTIDTYLKDSEDKLMNKLDTLFKGEGWYAEIETAVPTLILSVRSALETPPLFNAHSQLPYNQDETTEIIVKAFNAFFDHLFPRHYICFLGNKCIQEPIDDVYWNCLNSMAGELTMFREDVQVIAQDTVESVSHLRRAIHSINYLEHVVQDISAPQLWRDARSCFREYSRMMFCSMCVPDFLSITKDMHLCKDLCSDTLNHCLFNTLGGKFSDTWSRTLNTLDDFALWGLNFGDSDVRTRKRSLPEDALGNLSDTVFLVLETAFNKMPRYAEKVHEKCGNIPQHIISPITNHTKQSKITDKSRGLRQTVGKEEVVGVWQLFAEVTGQLKDYSGWWQRIPNALCHNSDARICWNGTHFDSYVRSALGVGPAVEGQAKVSGAPADDGIDIQTKLANLQKTLARNKADSSLENHGLRPFNNAQSSYPDLQNAHGNKNWDQFEGSGDAPQLDYDKQGHAHEDTHFWYPEDDEDSPFEGSGSGDGIINEHVFKVNKMVHPQADTKLKPMLPNSNGGTGKFSTSETHPDDKSPALSSSNQYHLSVVTLLMAFLSVLLDRLR